MALHNLTSADLSRASGISRAYLWKIRAGRVTAVTGKLFHQLVELPMLGDRDYSYVPYLATNVRVGALARAGVGIVDLRERIHIRTFDVRQDRQMARMDTVQRVIDVLRRVDELPKNPRVAQIARTQGKRSIESIDPAVLYDPLWDGQGAWRVHSPTTFHSSELFGRVFSREREIHHDQLMLRVQGLTEGEIRERLGLGMREYYRVVGRPFRHLIPSHYGARRRAQGAIVLGWLATGGDGRPEALRTQLGTSIIDLAELVARHGLIYFDQNRFRLTSGCARVAQERGTIRP